MAVVPLLGITKFPQLWHLDKGEFAVGVVCFLGALLLGPIAGIGLALDGHLAAGDRTAARSALAEARETVETEMAFPASAARLAAAENRIGRGAALAARRGGALVEALTDRELSLLRVAWSAQPA